MNLAEQYIQDVRSGSIVCCLYVKQAIDRHLNDLAKSQEADYPYYFDPEKGERAVEICKLFRHTKGKYQGKLFNLKPFQGFILYMLFGWVRKGIEDPELRGLRRFTKSYIEMARKNGKSELIAAINIILLLFDGEPGAEIYNIATKLPQAKIVFNITKKMILYLMEDYEEIDKLVGIHLNSIFVEETGSFIQPLAAEAKKEDGLNAHGVSNDEYHASKTSDLLEVMISSTVARTQPMVNTITTAGFNQDGPCFQLRKTCVGVLGGEIINDNLFTIIFALDEGDDWQDKTLWPKPNPNIGDSPYWHMIEKEFNEAMVEGKDKEIAFKCKNLNIWTNTYATWIQRRLIVQAGKKYTENDLLGRKCWGGLDLASTEDINALCLFFPKEGNEKYHHTLNYFWCPKDTAVQRSKKDGVSYREWHSQGFMHFTPGDTTDYNFIKAHILELAEKFDLQEISYDRWNSSQLVIDLDNEGITLFKFGQGWASMSTPTKELGKMYKQGSIAHRQNPVLTWMFSNVTIKRDPADNIKVDKSKSSEKVDGVVAQVMALGGWLDWMSNQKQKKSVYSERGAIKL